MERFILGKKEENHFLIEPLPLLSNMEEKITLWYEGVWGGMGLENL